VGIKKLAGIKKMIVTKKQTVIEKEIATEYVWIMECVNNGMCNGLV